LLIQKKTTRLDPASPFHIRNDCYYAENKNNDNRIS
jgi:hypothetical protein